MKIRRRDFIKLCLVGGLGMYLAEDFILRGPLTSFLEKVYKSSSITTSTTTTTSTSTTSKDEFQEFIEEYPKLAEGFEELNYRYTLKYFEAMPELKKDEDLHEFLNAHIRQWDYILHYYYRVGWIGTGLLGRMMNVDNSLMNLRIKDLQYHLKLDEQEKSLLPIRESELMKFFPNKQDREFINRCRILHPLFIEINIKTGDCQHYRPTINDWSKEDAKKALIDNLSFIVSGKAYERVITIGENDVKQYFDGCEIDAVETVPPWSEFFDVTMKKFKEEYLPVIREDERTNIGYIKATAIAAKDVLEGFKLPHPYRIMIYTIYTKALGYSGTDVEAEFSKYGFWDETTAGAVPQDFLIKLPKGRYAPGNMISRYVYGYDSKGNKLKLEVGVPVETKGDFFVEF
jgi:hypothetical protein